MTDHRLKWIGTCHHLHCSYRRAANNPGLMFSGLKRSCCAGIDVSTSENEIARNVASHRKDVMLPCCHSIAAPELRGMNPTLAAIGSSWRRKSANSLALPKAKARPSAYDRALAPNQVS